MMLEKEGLRFVLTAHGGLFVATVGMMWMLQLPVDKLDTHLMVRYSSRIMMNSSLLDAWTYF